MGTNYQHLFQMKGIVMKIETMKTVAIVQSIFWLIVLLGFGVIAENINIAPLQIHDGKTIVCFSSK
jgi:hypothetical protein